MIIRIKFYRKLIDMKYRILKYFLYLLSVVLIGCRTDSISNSTSKTVSNISSVCDRLTTNNYTLFRSRLGKEIDLYIYGEEYEGDNVTLIIGGIHGDEPRSRDLALDFIDYLDTCELNKDKPDKKILVIPSSNPDGLEMGNRVNYLGVDCNRNFPSSDWRKGKTGSIVYGGRKPASEPETKTIMFVVEKFKPSKIISIHSITGNRECNIYIDKESKKLAKSLSKNNKYPMSKGLKYPTPGSLNKWATENDILSVTLELPRNGDRTKLWERNKQALISVLE